MSENWDKEVYIEGSGRIEAKVGKAPDIPWEAVKFVHLSGGVVRMFEETDMHHWRLSAEIGESREETRKKEVVNAGMMVGVNGKYILANSSSGELENIGGRHPDQLSDEDKREYNLKTAKLLNEIYGKEMFGVAQVTHRRL